jgi:hypothetical protein
MKEQDGKVLAKNLISSITDPNIEQSMIEFVTHFTMDKQFEAKARCSKPCSIAEEITCHRIKASASSSVITASRCSP